MVRITPYVIVVCIHKRILLGRNDACPANATRCWVILATACRKCQAIGHIFHTRRQGVEDSDGATGKGAATQIDLISHLVAAQGHRSINRFGAACQINCHDNCRRRAGENLASTIIKADRVADPFAHGPARWRHIQGVGKA